MREMRRSDKWYRGAVWLPLYFVSILLLSTFNAFILVVSFVLIMYLLDLFLDFLFKQFGNTTKRKIILFLTLWTIELTLFFIIMKI